MKNTNIDSKKWNIMKKLNKTGIPATLLCDFYKISHREQYPAGTETVYSTWIPRYSRKEGINEVVAFGFQQFILRYLMDYFDEHFFNRDKEEVIDEYSAYINATLGGVPYTGHLEALYDLGYFPIKIKALKEGTLTPLRVPMLTIENTKPEFFWVTNWLETLMSCELWLPSTTATIALQFRQVLQQYANETNGDTSGVPFQSHDFSYRGMGAQEAAELGSIGHLLSFVGSDTIPAVPFLCSYYGANDNGKLVATSIPATEHSVMCAYGHDEFASYKRIITEIYPKGFVSIVSDTWNLWKVLTDVIKPLKNEIMTRDGRVVIRPDSGDPVKIVCGDPNSDDELERKGVIEILWEIFGGTITAKGYKQLDTHIGCIYGDAITIERCREICRRLKEKGFASTNMVFGIGSFTYQYNTRDTFSFALKATDVTINGVEHKIQKNPYTDKGSVKKSLIGRAVVLRDYKNGKLYVKDNLTAAEQEKYANLDQLETIYENGELKRFETLSEIRARVSENF